LETECAAVAGTPPGTRNHRLNVAAFSLGQIMATGGLNEQGVRDRLFEAAEACGLVADDGAQQVWATIDSGLTAAKHSRASARSSGHGHHRRHHRRHHHGRHRYLRRNHPRRSRSLVRNLGRNLDHSLDRSSDRNRARCQSFA